MNNLIIGKVNNHHSSIIRFTIISTPLLSLCEGCKFGCRYTADNVDMQQTPIILMQMSPDCGRLCPALRPARSWRVNQIPPPCSTVRYSTVQDIPHPSSTSVPPYSRSFLSLLALAHCSTSSCCIDVACTPPHVVEGREM